VRTGRITAAARADLTAASRKVTIDGTGRHLAAVALAAGVAVAGLTAGCGSQPAPQAGGQAPRARQAAGSEPLASESALAAGDLAFGLGVLRAWCSEQPTANVVLSPASLASGLGMAYLGARGSTARAMAAVLHLPSPTAAGRLEAGLRARARALRGLNGPGVTVADADEVWADRSLLPLRSYLDAVATGYAAGVGRVPLLADPARAAATIDAAVAKTTRGHIPHLLTAQDLTGALFVLTDAMYMKALWASPFSPASDSTARFTTATGQRAQAKYLNGGYFASASAGGWTAVSLPYQGGRLAMVALLPPAGTPGRACTVPVAGQLAALTSKVVSQHAAADTQVALPEVNLSNQAQLNGLLTGLGMGIAFGSDADFSGMSPAASNLGLVEHAATLKVDAQGTVASAATGVVVEPLADVVVRGPTVTFDRPYLLLVTDTATGEPLFLARVANPDLP
jgi:serine protease inhibitor